VRLASFVTCFLGASITGGCSPSTGATAGTDGGAFGDAAQPEAGAPDAWVDGSNDSGLEVLAAGLVHPYDLKVNATHVYFTTAFTTPGLVMRIPLDGGPPEELTTGPSPHTLVLDPANLYWTDYSPGTGAIMAMPLDGGTAVVLAANQYQPHGLAVDGSHVYWTTFNDPGQIQKVGLDGGAVTLLADVQHYPNNLAVDDQFVYWTNSLAATGTINKAPLDGSNTVGIEIAANQDWPYDIVVARQTLYWTNALGGQVMQMPVDGSLPPVALASGQLPEPMGLAFDGESLYWTNYSIPFEDSVGSIMTAPLDGGAWTELAAAQSYHLAVDGTSVYWTSYVGGTILRLTPK
jgi:hypothetical protein